MIDQAALAFLSIQFAAQPTLNQLFVPKNAIPTACVMMTELLKIGIAAIILLSSQSGRQSLVQWRFYDCLYYAGIPAASYAIQNLLIFTAYNNLDGLIFNLINQAKLLTTALLAYFILGSTQSPRQVLALVFLFTSAVIAVSSDQSTAAAGDRTVGLVAIISGTCLSGFGAVMSERAVCASNRNSLLFSAELGLIGLASLIALSAWSGELNKILEIGIWSAGPGSLAGMIPGVSQALGGLVIGYVTKTSGSVKKGLSVIVGLILTASLNSATLVMWGVAIPLAALGIWLHSSKIHKD